LCGLTGYSGKTELNQKIMDLIIAWNSFERGEDATGIYSPINGLKKTLDKGSDFVIYDNGDHYSPDTIFIGHVRHATVGGKKEMNNAHPFQRGNYVLAHNGTLRNYTDLAFKYNLPTQEYNVDSDYVAGSIAACNNISQVISEINGAAAFIITDTTKLDTLYVFRNKERNLYRGYDEERNMYISSTPGPLYYFELSGIKEFKEDILYIIKDGVILAAQSKKIKNTPYSKPIQRSRNSVDWDRHNDDDSGLGIGAMCGLNNLRLRHQPPKLLSEIKYTSTVNLVPKLYENVWLRSRSSCNVYNKDIDQRIELKHDEYYLSIAEGTSDAYIFIEYKGQLVEMRKSCFRDDDLIKENDLVMVLEDNTLSNTGKLIGNKGDIQKVTYLHNDSDLTTVLYPTEMPLLTVHQYVKKSSVRKLRKEELQDLTAIRENEAIIINIQNNDNKALERGNEIMVNEDKLVKLFDRLDDKLETLLEIAKTSYIQHDSHLRLQETIKDTLNDLTYSRDLIIDINSIKA